MPTKKALKKSLTSYKGVTQKLTNLLFARRVEMNALLRKLAYRDKQIAYLIKKAYPSKRYNPKEQEQILNRYLSGYNARIPSKGTSTGKSIYEHNKKTYKKKQK